MTFIATYDTALNAMAEMPIAQPSASARNNPVNPVYLNPVIVTCRMIQTNERRKENNTPSYAISVHVAFTVGIG